MSRLNTCLLGNGFSTHVDLYSPHFVSALHNFRVQPGWPRRVRMISNFAVGVGAEVPEACETFIEAARARPANERQVLLRLGTNDHLATNYRRM